VSSTKEQQRRRLATIRAIALLTVPASDRQRQPVDIEEDPGDDANPPENLPQVSRASHYS
jgi:hypothetical protein